MGKAAPPPPLPLCLKSSLSYICFFFCQKLVWKFSPTEQVFINGISRKPNTSQRKESVNDQKTFSFTSENILITTRKYTHRKNGLQCLVS